MAKPGLTLHRLELFLAVVDAGGIARAAAARNLSQPAVSEHILGLEQFFGTALFERAGRGTRPTAAAQRLTPFVRQALSLLSSAKQSTADLRGLQAGAVAIGASTTPGTYLLPPVLGRFHAIYPRIALTLRIGDTRDVEEWVAAGSVELGVIGAVPGREGLIAEPWVRDELVAIVGRRHTLARRRGITAAALAVEPYIAREPGSSTRATTERFFASAGLTLHPVMELGSTEAVREAVAAGLGVSIVSRHAVRTRDARIVPLRLRGNRWVRDLLIVRRGGAPLTPAADRLQTLLREQAIAKRQP